MAAELRIGVIGVGGRGALAAHAHKPEEGARLVAGADIKPAALAAFGEKYGKDCFLTDDWRELLKRNDIDAVFITSPDFLHEEQAVAALQAGKAVYLEKPMAITIAGCDRILETVCACEGKLYLGHNMRHMFFVQKMKELIEQGVIGEVKTAWCRHFVGYGGDAFFKDWHSERRNVTGLLLQKAAHDIDVLHWLCGGYTTRVNGMGGLTLYHQVQDRRPPDVSHKVEFVLENWPPLAQTGLSPVIDVEDVSMMQMELDNGVFAAYQQCHFAPDAWRNYTVIGTEGRIENYGDDPPNCTIMLWNKRSGYNKDADAQYPIETEGGTHGGADPKIVSEFLQYARDGIPTTTSPIAARNSVAAGYLATQSLRHGGIPFDVPPPPAQAVSYFEGVPARV